MTEDTYETRWMFGLLDYEHWRVFHLGKEIGLLILNTSDRSAAFRYLDEDRNRWNPDIPGQFMKAYRWARQHERED